MNTLNTEDNISSSHYNIVELLELYVYNSIYAKEGIIDIKNISYLPDSDFGDCQNTSEYDTPIAHRNFLEPFEPYVYDSTCDSKERIIGKISYLPNSELECIDCQNTRH
jgi:hypothetical protein